MHLQRTSNVARCGSHITSFQTISTVGHIGAVGEGMIYLLRFATRKVNRMQSPDGINVVLTFTGQFADKPVTVSQLADSEYFLIAERQHAKPKPNNNPNTIDY